MNSTTIFCGCSYVKGIGLPLEQSDPDLWVNIVYNAIPKLSATELVNLGVSGANNEDIFMSAINSLIDNTNCKYLFVAWTSLKRLCVYPGVEVYSTRVYFERSEIQDLKVNPYTVISGKYMENIRDRFFDLTHTHYDLLKILQYTNLINKLANQLNVKAFFVNSLLPVDIGYFNPVQEHTRLPSDTTPYTQQLLNLSSRDDQEYFKIYEKIHQDYKNTKGLDCNWINIDQGFRRYFYLDKGTDDLHPGPSSNKNFAHFITEKLHQINEFN